jgi:hypothetical protein
MDDRLPQYEQGESVMVYVARTELNPSLLPLYAGPCSWLLSYDQHLMAKIMLFSAASHFFDC